MEIKIEIGENLKNVMKDAISKAYMSNEEIAQVVAEFDLEGIVRAQMEGFIAHETSKKSNKS